MLVELWCITEYLCHHAPIHFLFSLLGHSWDSNGCTLSSLTCLARCRPGWSSSSSSYSVFFLKSFWQSCVSPKARALNRYFPLSVSPFHNHIQFSSFPSPVFKTSLSSILCTSHYVLLFYTTLNIHHELEFHLPYFPLCCGFFFYFYKFSLLIFFLFITEQSAQAPEILNNFKHLSSSASSSLVTIHLTNAEWAAL